MDNVLIDDRRIHVDFSQSVSHLWNRYRKQGKTGGDGQCEFSTQWYVLCHLDKIAKKLMTALSFGSFSYNLLKYQIEVGFIQVKE